jgi:hypothetical protein
MPKADGVVRDKTGKGFLANCESLSVQIKGKNKDIITNEKKSDYYN